ncbi:hypothetical protein C3489_36865 [Streptomyces sp. Ru71]|nr:hypothetical protein C3489_36865 [Streptomyces sp. Ru71]
MVKAARWPAVWAAFTVVMRFATGLAGIYRGWSVTAVTSVLIVACWYLVSRVRSRRSALLSSPRTRP